MSKLIFALLVIFFVALMGTQMIAAQGQGGGQGGGQGNGGGKSWSKV